MKFIKQTTLLLAILGIVTYFFFRLRKIQRQLETQNDQLNQLNQTKDKFFGIIAHDIRSPIVALDGIGQQMDFFLKKKDPTKLNRLTNLIDGTTKRLNQLLDNLLNWALLQTGVIPYRPTKINVSETVDEIIQLFAPTATVKNIKLENNTLQNQGVYADPTAFRTILRTCATGLHPCA